MSNFKERNYAIDFLRGCACISIILIHTAWWSGTLYLPNWFSNLFLFVDVPVFMFISGITYNYSESVGKNIKNILSQWNKWVFFLIIYLVVLFIFFRSEFDYTQIINYLFFSTPSNGSLGAVGGSMWFMSMYIKVTVFCSVILFFYNQNSNNIKFKHILLFMILLSMMNITFIDSYIAIYSFIFLLGYFSSKNKIKSLKSFLLFEFIAIIFILLIFGISGYGINDIQNLKFPPTIYYLLISIPGLLIIWYLKDYIKISKKNPMNYLGKNAIFFFYSQGISSSLLYLILPILNIRNIYIKFCLMALINILMAVSIGVITTILYNMASKILTKIKPYVSKLFMLDKN